jgi:hypothetical protein
VQEDSLLTQVQKVTEHSSNKPTTRFKTTNNKEKPMTDMVIWQRTLNEFPQTQNSVKRLLGLNQNKENGGLCLGKNVTIKDNCCISNIINQKGRVIKIVGGQYCIKVDGTEILLNRNELETMDD